MTQAEPAIVHLAEQGRFELIIDGHVSELEYQLHDGVMVILHTGVPPEVGGRGIAARLTEAALAAARENGWKVRPRCSYAAVYFKRHPEYNDLLA
ncbi:GNAT family N-acetyltransferase [Bordetella pseudohinzii]|nr:GNAT family N-acetyltransferase [Bordetella pseudohinzii]ANY15295.1 acetyltransferase [Bordetella pseudohinzii]KMM27403.1 acetyltransferase [Bordetella pseudohinzii]KXA80513.1 acetyltransferase [Bordetella pseudohinzii]KXA82424.1 acetyltransferase [Bordetella pseudohinzii]